MIVWTPKLIDAQRFFREAHDSIGQIRKYTREPYWTHTEWTMERLSWITSDESYLIGQLGHDFWEDVVPKNPAYYARMVLERYGEVAFNHMRDLTDVYTKEAYPTWNRAKRHAHEKERLATIPISSKNGKIVDLIHNTQSIVAHDKDFAKVYLKEKYLLLQVLKDGDKEAWDFAYNQVLEGISLLGLDISKIKS